MKLRLKKIHFRDEDRTQLHMSIDANYGWEREMYSDLIRVNFNVAKKKLYLTIEASNPGIGNVIERIIESVNEIDMDIKSPNDYPVSIVENLAENFGMEYDPESVKKILA